MAYVQPLTLSLSPVPRRGDYRRYIVPSPHRGEGKGKGGFACYHMLFAARPGHSSS